MVKNTQTIRRTGQNQQMVKEHSVDNHPGPSGLTSTDTPWQFYRLLRVLSLQNTCWTFCQTCISHHGWWKFSNSWYSNYWKIHLRVRKLNLDIFTGNNRSQVLVITPTSRGMTLKMPQKQGFCRKYISPGKKGRGMETMIILKQYL